MKNTVIIKNSDNRKLQGRFLCLSTMILAILMHTACKREWDNPYDELGTNYKPIDTTDNTPTWVSDMDGNTYPVVQIGTQSWMAKNLQTTKYNDGVSIPLVSDETEWNNLTTPGYCQYENITNPYGLLYNWYAVSTNKICPSGWHVPSDDEWAVLVDYLGGSLIAGGKLKEEGTSYWKEPNLNASNSTGFNALPGGVRNAVEYANVTIYGFWWSTTPSINGEGWARTLWYSNGEINRSSLNKSLGLSVRCIKDDGTTVTLPTVTTLEITDITETSATMGGNITIDGGATVTARGVCWSTGKNPTIEGSKTNDGGGTGTFNRNIIGLTKGTTYYVRAYATNSVGTAYGNELSFTTNQPFTFNEVTNPATGKTWMDRNLGATQVATSSTDVSAYGDLYQWGRRIDGHEKRTSGTTPNREGSDTPEHGNFILAPNSPSDWRSPQNDNLWQGADGINNPCPSGYRLPTAPEWANEVDSWTFESSSGAFASPLKLPMAGRRNMSDGSLDNIGLGGYYWSSSVESIYAMSLKFYNSGYDDGFVYRAYGFSVRCIKNETTTVTLPIVTTTTVTNITSTSAIGGGNISSDGGAAITARGICYSSTSQTPTITDNQTVDGTGTGSFSSNLSGLTSNTTYYLRAYATNSSGTGYGNVVSFTTNPTLASGEVWNPITGKILMDRNLGATQVATSSTDEASYGDLYQWGRATDGHQKRTSSTTSTLSTSDSPNHDKFIIANASPFDWRNPQNDNLWNGENGINNPCPEGFRIPTEAEWENERLSWSSNNISGAFNSPLKLSIPGYRSYSVGEIAYTGTHSFYWSSTIDGIRSKHFYFNSGGVGINSLYRSYGMSVRCIKE